jgi:hypothetical protein
VGDFVTAALERFHLLGYAARAGVSRAQSGYQQFGGTAQDAHMLLKQVEKLSIARKKIHIGPSTIIT